MITKDIMKSILAHVNVEGLVTENMSSDNNMELSEQLKKIALVAE